MFALSYRKWNCPYHAEPEDLDVLMSGHLPPLVHGRAVLQMVHEGVPRISRIVSPSSFSPSPFGSKIGREGMLRETTSKEHFQVWWEACLFSCMPQI